MNVFVIVSLFTLSMCMGGCSKNETTSNNHTVETSPIASPSPVASASEVPVERSDGILDISTQTYTETVDEKDAVRNSKFTIVFHVNLEKDESNSSQYYIDDVDFVSLDPVSWWEKTDFQGIEEVQYEDNHQVANIIWSYIGTHQNEQLERKQWTRISLYDLPTESSSEAKIS